MNTMSEKSVLVAAALLMLYSAGGCAERQTSRGDALILREVAPSGKRAAAMR
jgi:hypothetical protein